MSVSQCPACAERRCHTTEEFNQFHPVSQTDFSREHGKPPEKNK